MSLIKIIKGKNKGNIFLLVCDWCHKSFYKKHKKRFIKTNIHFCCGSCSAKHRNFIQKQKGIEIIKNAQDAYNKMCSEDVNLRKIVTKKALATIKERYNVENISQIPEIKNKKIKSSKEKYNVNHPMMSESVKIKIHQTMKKNGTYKKNSKPEMIVKDILEQFYGDHNIIHQKYINKWNIDFYIIPLNTYIQVDGVYWHGIGKTIEELEQFSDDRIKSILKTKITDENQNIWFKENNMRLIRITDIEIKQNTKNGCFDYLYKVINN